MNSRLALFLLCFTALLHADTITTTVLDVGTRGTTGQYTSQAVVNGNPAISYYDSTSQALKYMRATDASGTTWGTPVAVATGGVGQFTSMVVVNGNPAITYSDSLGSLKYVRATDVSGTSWGTPTAFGFGGLYTSLAVVNGNPAISYYSTNNACLEYVRAGDANGTSWGTPVFILGDTYGLGGPVGLYSSLKVVNGKPAICFSDWNGGNSFYQTTERRDVYLAGKGLRFIGAGVSGGEEGARKGPSIMPGGPASTWEVMKPIFESIAAKVDGEPCVIHIGLGGAGHYVKMIHNGIEYGDMQLICEAYNIFKHAGFTTDEMAAIFNEWNEGDLLSYLIQISGKALEQKDPETGKPVVELIVDKAGQKGTGQWTLLNAAENAVVISTINAAVEARILSSQKKQRVAASTQLTGPMVNITTDKKELVKKVHDALYASKIISYAQGLDLIQTMGAKKDWKLDLGRIAAIWRGGGIIRAKFLNRITDAYRTNASLANLMLDPFFKDVLSKTQQNWREVVSIATLNGIPVPAFSASLGYYDSYRAARLPANLLQAQRDFFGAHTYERTDKPEGQMFHTEWPEVIG